MKPKNFPAKKAARRLAATSRKEGKKGASCRDFGVFFFEREIRTKKYRG